MPQSKLKESVYIITFCIVNIILSFVICNSLGISNIVILKTYSVIYSEVTYEVVIFWVLSIYGSSIYEYFKNIKLWRNK